MHDADVNPVELPYVPAKHSPEHPAVDSPTEAPYVPAGHDAVQVDVDSPAVAPYNPTEQFTHTAAPAKLYVPGKQMAAKAVVDPASQL